MSGAQREAVPSHAPALPPAGSTETSPRLKFKATSLHHEFNPAPAGPSRTIVRHKSLKAGNDATINGKNRRQLPDGEEGPRPTSTPRPELGFKGGG